MKYFKVAIYIFLIIFTVILFYIGLQAQKDINSAAISTTNESNNSALVAVPVNEENISYKGTIKKTLGAPYEYSLNVDGEPVLYLKSTNQDLGLMSGLDTEVIGDVQGNYEGIAIMDVKSIKLK